MQRPPNHNLDVRILKFWNPDYPSGLSFLRSWDDFKEETSQEILAGASPATPDAGLTEGKFHEDDENRERSLKRSPTLPGPHRIDFP